MSLDIFLLHQAYGPVRSVEHFARQASKAAAGRRIPDIGSGSLRHEMFSEIKVLAIATRKAIETDVCDRRYFEPQRLPRRHNAPPAQSWSQEICMSFHSTVGAATSAGAEVRQQLSWPTSRFDVSDECHNQ
ncbi:hypothetical protein [Nocardia sp. NPDC057455]|uniref:hypothetical protein n=1 Tax=Nocardia sp. NPDC057455 TaxID=3346138 RepID=UPI00366F07F6